MLFTSDYYYELFFRPYEVLGGFKPEFIGWGYSENL